MTFLNNSIVLIFLTIFFSCCNDNRIEFNSKKWKKAENYEQNWALRWDMSDDLINNYDLIGKDTNQIFKLLGKTKIDCYGNYCQVSYTLGPCRTGINDGNLILTIKKGKVCEISKNCN